MFGYENPKTDPINIDRHTWDLLDTHHEKFRSNDWKQVTTEWYIGHWNWKTTITQERSKNK